MKRNTDNAYSLGYAKGFQAGYLRCISDMKENATPRYDAENILALPIESLGLQTRALNCLRRSNCICIQDVAQLSDSQIRVMRNLGPKTAREIVCALRCREIHAPVS